MARVIGVFSGKGGAGKTTLAVNLGAILAKHYGHDVTLMDCNLTTSHVGLHLGMYNYNVALNNVLRGEYEPQDAVYTHQSGLKIIPASVSISDVRGVDIDGLPDVVKKLESMNDVIILDAAPSLGREAYAAFKAAEEVLYVTNPQLPSVVDIIRCQAIANETNTSPLGIVTNMVTNDKNEMKKQEVEYLTELPVIGSIPYDNKMRQSMAMKMPITMMKPSSSSSREMFRLASRIIEGQYVQDLTFAQFLKERLKFW